MQLNYCLLNYTIAHSYHPSTRRAIIKSIDKQVTDSEIEMIPPLTTSKQRLSSFSNGLHKGVKSKTYNPKNEVRLPSASVISANSLNPSLSSNTKSDVLEFPEHVLKQFQVCI